MKARYLYLAGATLLLGALLAWLDFRAFARAPLAIPESGVHLVVERGTPVRAVIRELGQRGVTEPGWRWRLLTRIEPVTIQAGEYALTAGLSPRALLALLANGNVVRYQFTIVEGWTFRQLQAALAAEPQLAQSTTGLDSEVQLLQAINPELEHPEGWFLPETYQYVRGDSGLDILRRAHDAMQRELERAWAGRAPDLPLKSAYELLVLASIVERETSLDAERADIAGVFVRRLQQGWRLETDPTVIYGLGQQFDGDLRRRDLVADSPYNTYTRFGLPPTPIALPGALSLQAVAHPAAGTAMFFVASGAGGHVFSETLEEHNAAVRAMLRKTP
jgi:UPF0755 protein